MRNIFIVSVVLAVVLGLHWYLIGENLYRAYWWVDIVMHALGGAWVALAFMLLGRMSGIARIVVAVFLVGFAWEVLEFIFDVPFLGVGEARWDDPIWQLDTIADLFIDVVSGALLWSALHRYTGK